MTAHLNRGIFGRVEHSGKQGSIAIINEIANQSQGGSIHSYPAKIFFMYDDKHGHKHGECKYIIPRIALDVSVQ